MSSELLNTVQWAGIQSCSAVWLSLKSNSDMLNWAGDDGVGNSSESPGSVVLGVGKVTVLATGTVAVVVLELAFGEAKGTKLDGYTGSDTD